MRLRTATARLAEQQRCAHITTLSQQQLLLMLLLLQVVYFKTNRKFIHEYPNLRGYVQVRQQALMGHRIRTAALSGAQIAPK